MKKTFLLIILVLFFIAMPDYSFADKHKEPKRKSCKVKHKEQKKGNKSASKDFAKQYGRKKNGKRKR